MVSRKYLHPTIGHSICSEHFVGGNNNYVHNVPTSTPKTAKQTPPYERKTVKARNRNFVNNVQAPLPKDHGDGCFTEDNRPHVVLNNDDADHDDDHYDETRELNNTEDVLRAQMANLILENNKLKSENEKLSLEKTVGKEATYELWLERVKVDHKMFRFYTGICDYTTFEALYKYLGPAVHNLAYKDSQTNSGNILIPEYVKRGPKRTLNPEEEYFLVLVRLRLGLLEEDLAYRAGLSQPHMSFTVLDPLIR